MTVLRVCGDKTREHAKSPIHGEGLSTSKKLIAFDDEIKSVDLRRASSGITKVACCPFLASGGVMSISSALRFPLLFGGVSGTDLRPDSLAGREKRVAFLLFDGKVLPRVEERSKEDGPASKLFKADVTGRGVLL